MALRVGIDTVAVQSVRDALAAHGERYLERVYTAREVADCEGIDGPDPERLAARFAAKEAALKVLRAGAGGVPWPAVEVHRDPSGWTGLALSGPAAALAREAGIGELAVSLTHEAGMASAVVVADTLEDSQVLADTQTSSPNVREPMTDRIRQILAEHARLNADPGGLAEHADLYQAGMTSHASVQVMLALEDEFDVEFPDAMLKRSVFESIASIAAALGQLVPAEAAA